MRYWLEVAIDPEDGTPFDFVDVQVYADASPVVLHAIARDLARIEGYDDTVPIYWEYFQGRDILQVQGWTER